MFRDGINNKSDDAFFDEWKEELEEELASFWNEMLK